MPRLSKADDAAYHTRYRELNRELLREKSRIRYMANIEAERERCRLKANGPKARNYQKQWAKENQARRTANENKRRASKLQATPKWLTNAHLGEILHIYEQAKELSWLSVGGLEVDHILPLQGKTVCGLHVPWNLQILPENLNRKKHNKVID